MGAIIGLSGYSGAGKDYVADAIIKDFPEYQFKKMYFADHLKRIAAAMLGVDVELMYTQEGKQQKIDWLDGMTIRTFLQKFGTDGVRKNVHSDFWPRSLMNQIGPKDNVIIPDMRFKNELEVIAESGFYARVDRIASITEWNKLSGIGVYDQEDFDPIGKRYYIRLCSDHLEEHPYYAEQYDSMVHESEVALDNIAFQWNYILNTGQKPEHGVRLSQYIFQNGYIKWD
jgi:hypothetical protein